VNTRLKNSYVLWEKAKGLILSGTNTMSKSPRHIAPGACPVFVDRAQGPYFWDVDGNRYLDFPLGLGAVVLGHAHPAVEDAVAAQLRRGSLPTLNSPLEVELAERLCSLIPCCEKLRLLKSGSEAMSAAVRLAKAFTGRETVAVCGYHGWHDWTVARMGRNLGVPACLEELVTAFHYNDIESLEAVFDAHPGQVAAVVMEPVGFDAPHQGFLEKVASLARREGALLVFDEVLTGFRLALGGAQSYFGVVPDLAGFGKALTNGHGLSLVCGRREILDAVEERVFISSTFGGETGPIAAALATLDELSVPGAMERLSAAGDALRQGLNSVFTDAGLHVVCKGLSHKSGLFFTDQAGVSAKTLETLFRARCLERGVFLGYGHFVSLSHGPEEIGHAVAVAAEVAHSMVRDMELGHIPAHIAAEAEDVFKRY